MSFLSIRSLSKSYLGTEVSPALKQFDLEVEKGEFIVIVGASGCGKSTLLRTIAGLERISSGEIWLNHKSIHQLEPQKRSVSMMFQSYTLFPHYNVYQNMAFGLKARRVSKKVIQEKVLSMAQTLQIQEYLERMPHELSGGQRQRVALGRALLKDPDILLLDEPLSNLDAKMRTDMRIELQNLHSSIQTTMILVTHDQVEAMTLADRIVVMENGEIQQVGTPEDIYNQPANTKVADFIGSPGMNLLSGTLSISSTGITWEKDSNQWYWNTQDFYQLISKETQNWIEQALQEQSNLTLQALAGIRPEHFQRSIPEKKFPLSGTVLFGEPMGSHTLYHLQIPCNTGKVKKCVVSLSNRETLRAKEKETFYVDSSKLCFFYPNNHPKSGKRM